MDSGSGMLGGASVLLVLFLLVIGVLWLILPFAVFGIKGKLDVQLYRGQQLLDELKALRADLQPLIAVAQKLRANADSRDGGRSPR